MISRSILRLLKCSNVFLILRFNDLLSAYSEHNEVIRMTYCERNLLKARERPAPISGFNINGWSVPTAHTASRVTTPHWPSNPQIECLESKLRKPHAGENTFGNKARKNPKKGTVELISISFVEIHD
jgi:hypothetical protein